MRDDRSRQNTKTVAEEKVVIFLVSVVPIYSVH